MKVLALDIGGTNIKAGIIDGSGKVSDLFRYAVFNEDRTEKGIVQKLVRILLPLSKKKISKQLD